MRETSSPESLGFLHNDKVREEVVQKSFMRVYDTLVITCEKVRVVQYFLTRETFLWKGKLSLHCRTFGFESNVDIPVTDKSKKEREIMRWSLQVIHWCSRELHLLCCCPLLVTCTCLPVLVCLWIFSRCIFNTQTQHHLPVDAQQRERRTPKLDSIIGDRESTGISLGNKCQERRNLNVFDFFLRREERKRKRREGGRKTFECNTKGNTSNRLKITAA